MILKNFLVTIILSFASLEGFAKDITLEHPAGWEKKESWDGSAAFKKNDQFNSTLVIKKHKLRKSMNWDEKGLNKKISKIKSLRSRLLSLVGIEKWNIEKHKLITMRSKNDTLIFIGSYVGTKKQKVLFYELNVYEGKEHFQITYTQDRPDSLNIDEAKKLFMLLREKI